MGVGRTRGYTLLELLVVVGIIALIAVVAVPKLSSNDEERLLIAATEMADAIRFARSETLRNGAPHGFTIDAASKKLQLFRLHSPGGPIIILPSDPSPTMYSESYEPAPEESYPAVFLTELRHPVTKQPYLVDIDNHPFARADSVATHAKFLNACSTADQISFDSSGIARCFGSSAVALQELEITMSLGAYSQRVQLDGLTGRVTLQ